MKKLFFIVLIFLSLPLFAQQPRIILLQELKVSPDQLQEKAYQKLATRLSKSGYQVKKFFFTKEDTLHPSWLSKLKSMADMALILKLEKGKITYSTINLNQSSGAVFKAQGEKFQPVQVKLIDQLGREKKGYISPQGQIFFSKKESEKKIILVIQVNHQLELAAANIDKKVRAELPLKDESRIHLVKKVEKKSIYGPHRTAAPQFQLPHSKKQLKKENRNKDLCLYIGAGVKSAKAYEMDSMEDSSFQGGSGFKVGVEKKLLKFFSAGFSTASSVKKRTQNLSDQYGFAYGKVNWEQSVDMLAAINVYQSVSIFRFGFTVQPGLNISKIGIQPDSSSDWNGDTSASHFFGFKVASGVFIEVDTIIPLYVEGTWEMGRTERINHNGFSVNVMARVWSI